MKDDCQNVPSGCSVIEQSLCGSISAPVSRCHRCESAMAAHFETMNFPDLSKLNPSILPRGVRDANDPDAPPNPARLLNESCIGKGIMSFVMGGGLGVAGGIIIGSYSALGPPVPVPGQPPPETLPWRQELKEAARKTRLKCKAWGKSFAYITMLFSGTECVVEKIRGQHDLGNGVTAGCATGAFLGRSGGVQGMCFGCAGFAAFSIAIDYFMVR